MNNTADINYFKDPLANKTGEEAFKNKLPSILESHETEINLKIYSSEKTTTGEANKIFTFSDEAKTWKDILKIKKSSTEALDLQNDSGTSIMTVDTQNQEIVGSGALKLMPTGFIGYSPVSTVPIGWIKCNGAGVSRTTYARLFSVIGTTFGAGDGSTTFNLPDLRGYFIRGWDDGRGVDSGRVLGSYQGDAIRNITGALASLSSIGLGPFTSQGGALFSGDVTTTLGGAGGVSTARMGSIQFDANRQVPTASENRPRNIALMPIIKY